MNEPNIPGAWNPTWEVSVTRQSIRYYLKAFPGVTNSIHHNKKAARRVPGATDIVGPGAMIMGYLDEFICQTFRDGMMAGRVKTSYEKHEVEVDFKEALQPGDVIGFFMGETRERDMKYGERTFPSVFVDLEIMRRRGNTITTTHRLKLIMRPTEVPGTTQPSQKGGNETNVATSIAPAAAVATG